MTSLVESSYLPRGVVVVGDVLVDVIEDRSGSSRRYPGGAALNVAVDVRRLGLPSTLAAPFASDQDGDMLRRAAVEAGVTLVALECMFPTMIATSRRIAGEPTYTFSDWIHQRKFVFAPDDVRRLCAGNVLAVSSFPMHDMDQVEELLRVVDHTGQVLVVDPNARPAFLADLAAYVAGFRRLAGAARVVKLSEQDISQLGLGEPVGAVRELLESGVDAVVLTRAERGASVFTNGGIEVSVPVPDRLEAVVDTMGAGDATLARILYAFVKSGTDLNTVQWETLLHEAMAIAGDVCRIDGGNLPTTRPVAGNL